MVEAAETPSFRRRFMRRRVEAAIAGRGTALAIGAVMLISAAAYVLGVRGDIGPEAWKAGLLGGCVFAFVRAVLSVRGGRDDPDLLREVLGEHFGPEIREDQGVTRLARQAIEQRVQLANARASAPKVLAQAIESLVPILDQRIDAIAVEARSAALRRGAARFQAGMAQLARQRLDEVSRIAESDELAGSTEVARKAADGLSRQVEASGGLVSHAEDQLMALDSRVAELGTIVARALLAISKVDRPGLEALAQNLGPPPPRNGDPGRT